MACPAHHQPPDAPPPPNRPPPPLKPPPPPPKPPPKPPRPPQKPPPADHRPGPPTMPAAVSMNATKPIPSAKNRILLTTQTINAATPPNSKPPNMAPKMRRSTGATNRTKTNSSPKNDSKLFPPLSLSPRSRADCAAGGGSDSPSI